MLGALFLALVACDSPDSRYWNGTATQIEIDGRRYSVHRRSRPRGGDLVQVIRHGYARRPEHVAILEAMRQAATQATGCALKEDSVRGDSGVMEAVLTC